jgi:lactate dehydrogenase-like 2-hydroxyacid dehydrogenase
MFKVPGYFGFGLMVGSGPWLSHHTAKLELPRFSPLHQEFMRETILVVEKELQKGRAAFDACDDFRLVLAPADEGGLAALIRQENARAVIVGMHPYKGALYQALGETGGGRGALIARFGVGHDNIDKRLAREHGCLVANTPGALDVSVAEHTLWLIGAFMRHLAAADVSVRRGEWCSAAGTELRGKTLGLIGFGRIARQVAAIAHFGFGLRVLTCGRSTAHEWSARHGADLAAVQKECGLEQYTTDPGEILRSADFISLHLPASPENRHFINAARLAQMQKHGVLVNTARGSVLDEGALFDALTTGQIAGAALDVFENEPYHPADPQKDLRTLPNILLTPHIGSNTVEANRRMAEKCLANVRAFFGNNLSQIATVS